MAPPSGTDRSHAATMPPSSNGRQRQKKSVPVIKIVQVHAPMLVRANVANFRALVQKMTGNVAPSDSRTSLLEAECSPREFAEPEIHQKAVYISHRQAPTRSPMARLQPLLQQAQRRPHGSEKCLTRFAACVESTDTQSSLGGGVKEVKREAWTGDNDCPGEGIDGGEVEDMDVFRKQSSLPEEMKREVDTRTNYSSAECVDAGELHGELDHECESPDTSTCESAHYTPAHIVNAATQPHDDSVDSFFADGGDGDDNGHFPAYEARPCRYINNGSFSSIGNVCSAAYNNYLPPFNCGRRASYEMPGGFDYFSV